MSLSINDVAELFLAGQLPEYDRAQRDLARADRERQVADERQPLEPLDDSFLFNFHRAGVDIGRAYGAKLRAQAEREEREPRRVIR
jgi:hypothetical protein